MKTNNLTDNALGKCGEHITCVDLMSHGYNAFKVEEALSYDLVLDINGYLLRVQVKTTRGTTSAEVKNKNYPALVFDCRKGNKSYSQHDIDLMAFVCLDTMEIGYVDIYNIKQKMQFKCEKYDYPKGIIGKFLSENTLEAAIDNLNIRGYNISTT